MPGTDITSKDLSIFLQYGGAGPANALKVAGLDGQHVAVTGLTRTTSDVKPDFGYDPTNPGQYEARAALASPPDDFDSFTLASGELSGNVPRALMRDGMPFNLYMNAGGCVDPTNPLAFVSYVEIASDCVVAGNDGGDRKARAEDAVLLDSLSVKARGGLYVAGPLIFSEQQPSAVAAQITFGNRYGNCTPAGAETLDVYVGVAASGATVPKLRYTNDGGATWADLAITGITATEALVGIAVLGEYLVVATDKAGSATQSGYYVTTIDQDTGVPASTWSKVTSGIQANDLLTDMWAERDAIYLVAQKGWIYKTRTPLTGVTTVRQGSAAGTNVSRIRGRNGVLAAALADGTVLVSVDGGTIWAASAAIAVATPLAIGVVDAKRIYVGAGSGVLKYTDNGGKTWSTLAFSGSGAGTVDDIAVVSPEVVQLAHNNGGVGRLVATWTGGAAWTRTENRIRNLTTNNGLTRLAVPSRGSRSTQANVLAAAGTAASGTAGSVQIGRAPIV